MKNQTLKIVFGMVIFLFGAALAYFTANYLSANQLFDYWGTIALFAGAYVLIGIAISFIFSISLGFLFAADVLIIHLLFNYYGHWADALKVILLGGVLLVLYAASAVALRDKPQPISEVAQGASPTSTS